MRQLDLHCIVDETAFSWTIFLTRLCAGGALLYISIGGLLFYREFLSNIAAFRFPLSVGIGLLVAGLFLGLLLVLGWFTRIAAAASVLCMGAVSLVFFGANFNKIYVALVLLMAASLLPATLLGPGKISLDYRNAVSRAKKNFRG